MKRLISIIILAVVLLPFFMHPTDSNGSADVWWKIYVEKKPNVWRPSFEICLLDGGQVKIRNSFGTIWISGYWEKQCDTITVDTSDFSMKFTSVDKSYVLRGTITQLRSVECNLLLICHD